MGAAKTKPFTALTSDEDVGKVMKVALPSTKKMIKAGFTRNDSDDQGNKSGFPYLQKKNTRVLMNDFSFAMQIVANIQYALRKNKNEAENCIREMQKPNGTIRCLVSANEKKGLFHRKYVVNATKLSDSLENENGFKGILRIVYENYKDPDNKSVEDIITNLLKTLKTKAKRMTNWIMNGPDTLRAIWGILEQTNIATKGQLKSVEDVLAELSKQDEKDTSTQKNDSIIMPKDFEKHVDLYKKLFGNPAKAHYILHGESKYWVPILTYDQGDGNLKYIFDGQNYRFTDEELRVIKNIFEKHTEYEKLEKWCMLSGFEADKNAGKWYASEYDLSDYCNQMEQCAKKIGEYLNKKPSPVPNPEPQPKKVKLWWPNATAQDKSTIDDYLEFFPKDKDNANKLYGIPITIGNDRAFVPSTMRLADKVKDIVDTTKKAKIIEILNNLWNGGWTTVDINMEVKEGSESSAGTYKSGLEKYVLEKINAPIPGAGGPQPGPNSPAGKGTVPIRKSVPAGVAHNLRDLADRHLGIGEKLDDDHRAVNPSKRNAKFDQANLPKRPTKGVLDKDEITFDGARRFYMTDGTVECLRKNKVGGHNSAIPAGITADKNNETLRAYFAKPENANKPGAKLECDVVFEEIQIPQSKEKNYAREAGSKTLVLGSGVLKSSGTKKIYDSVDVIFAANYLFATGSKKILCVDAANEVTAGGTAGSTVNAVEESLCADTSLYQSLTGGGMDEYYIDDKGGTEKNPRAKFHYNPNKISIAKDVIVFPRDDTPGTAATIDDRTPIHELKHIDVMVHASPNFNPSCTPQCPSYALDYSDEQAQDALDASANQMMKAAVQGEYDAFIIPNLGGGVFMNSVTGWVEAWKKAISKFGKNITIVFAVFDGKIWENNSKTNKPNKPKETHAGEQISDLYATIPSAVKKTKAQLKAELRAVSG